MTCIRIPNGIVCVEIEREVVDENGRTWRFTFSEYLGPTVIGAYGNPLARQPGQRSPFWPAFDAWLRERDARKAVNP